jgi:hypothetical protein
VAVSDNVVAEGDAVDENPAARFVTVRSQLPTTRQTGCRPGRRTAARADKPSLVAIMVARAAEYRDDQR